MRNDLLQVIIALLIQIPLFAILYLFTKKHMYQKPKKLQTFQSDYLGDIDIVEYEKTKELQLKTGECVHGISTNRPLIEKSYWYKVAQKTIAFTKNKNEPQILMLGLGANTTTQIISKMNSSIKQTIIDIDQVIVEICNKYFKLDTQPNTTIKIGDIYELLKQQNLYPHQFDVIIIDIFLGESPFLLTDTGSPTVIMQILNWLKPDGMLIFNRPANTQKGKTEGQELKQYLQTIFTTVNLELVDDPAPYYFQNYIITAEILNKHL